MYKCSNYAHLRNLLHKFVLVSMGPTHFGACRVKLSIEKLHLALRPVFIILKYMDSVENTLRSLCLKSSHLTCWIILRFILDGSVLKIVRTINFLVFKLKLAYFSLSFRKCQHFSFRTWKIYFLSIFKH